MIDLTESSALDAIQSKSIRELMCSHVLTVYEGWSIRRLAGFFVKHNISGAPVIAADDELVGVVSQSDLVRFESKAPTEQEIERLVQFYCGPYGGDLSKNNVEQMKEKANDYCTVHFIMTPEVASIDVSLNAAQACQALVERKVHRLFITENGRLVGVVSAMDFLRALVPASSN